MDWLEEMAEKIQKYLRKASFIRSLICYLVIAMICAMVINTLLDNVCQAWLSVMLKRYPDAIEYVAIGDTNVERLNMYAKGAVCPVGIVWLFYRYKYMLLILIFQGIAIKLFYVQRVKPPTEALRQSIDYLSMGDYSHEMGYYGGGEFGQLCSVFEEMRSQLIREKKRYWQSDEKQRQINAIFAHDIRTPLTVIKGYTEMLIKYFPQGKVSEEMLLEKLKTMHDQEERLLSFSKTMTTIQAMEKWELSCKWHSVQKLVVFIEQMAEGLIENSCIRIQTDCRMEDIACYVDDKLLMEVCQNLLSNSMRYAKSKIQVSLKIEGNRLLLSVQDDGEGFTEKALQKGMVTYFSEAENSSEHFGIGLSICDLLCECHGGKLHLVNSIQGGAIVIAEFFVLVKN